MFRKSSYVIMGAVLAFMLNCAAPTPAFATSDNDLLALGGAKIIHGNCDADALVSEDEGKKPYEQSCLRQGVSLYGKPDKPFKITIHYDADADPVANLAMAGILQAIGGAAVVTAFGIWALIIDNDYEMELNSSKNIGFVTFENKMIGDKVCVYARLLGIAKLKVNRATYNTVAEDVTEVGTYPNISKVPTTTMEKLSGLPSNCIHTPPPRSQLQPPAWSNLISKVCTNYDSSASNFRWAPTPYSKDPRGDSRSFTGVVVQCIEETMNNIFVKTGPVTGETFFTKAQNGLVNAIRGLLALYVIFFGYQFIVEKKGIKQSEWIWFGLKIALVFYFAAGSGMTDMLPRLQTFSKSMSLIVMEAGAGNQIQAQEALGRLEAAENAFEAASQDLTAARYRVAKAQNAANSNPGNAALQAELNAARKASDEKLAIYNLKLEELNETRSQADSYGYKYCDFRDIGDAAYIDSKGVDHRDMRLWDMVDCKLSKYLGVGDHAQVKDAPNVLVIAVAAVFSHVFGIFIFFFAIVILVFIILITVRVVHIYIMASIALVLLVFISPLLIPAVLFNFTKSIFDAWLNNIIAYTVQPILLFTFLAFLFSAFDMVIYDKNHKFVPMTTAHKIDENRICMIYTKNGGLLCKSGDFDGIPEDQLKCVDEDAPGCLYQKLHIKERGGILGVSLYDIDLSYGEGKILLIGFLKMIIICFISHAVLGLVERMSITLTNAAAGGVTRLSSAPKPGDVAKPGMQATKTLGRAVGHIGSGALGAAKKRATAGKVRNSLREGGMSKNEKKAKDKKDAANAKALAAHQQMTSQANARGAHQQMIDQANANDRKPPRS